MACYTPVRCWRKNDGGITFTLSKARSADSGMKVPCGICIGCRLDRARQWATRIMHEAREYDDNYFVTLTYADNHLPDGSSLNYSDVQKFLKRLRKKRSRRIRYYCVGEYGGDTGRPHYHLCLFNCDCPDKYVWRKNAHEHVFYRSDELEKLWPLGHSDLSVLSEGNALYCARYIMEKQLGDYARDKRVDIVDGEILERPHEFAHMSKGIGKRYVEQFGSDIYEGSDPGYIIVDGRKVQVPRYYDDLLSADADIPVGKMRNCIDRTKAVKRARGRSRAADATPERLAVRQICAEDRMSRKERKL